MRFCQADRSRVAKEFDPVTEIYPRMVAQNKRRITRQCRSLAWIGYLKPRVVTFVKESNLLDATALAEVLRKMDTSVATDKKQFMSGMNEALRPITKRLEGKSASSEPIERAQRKEFARSSIDDVKFETIPGTDEHFVIWFGSGWHPFAFGSDANIILYRSVEFRQENSTKCFKDFGGDG